ncbi:MAG: PilT/PilU family type 4a pilus ATPase [Myxococcota bacterium]
MKAATPSEGENYKAQETVLRILKGALAAGASDIHLRAAATPMVRIRGQLCPLDHPPLDEATITGGASALARWAGISLDLIKRNQCDFSCQIPNVTRIRCHLYKQNGTLGLIARNIPSEIPDFTSLRLPPVMKRIAMQNRGLILVTGATRNGKSTTIASMLEYINKTTSKHIVTIEDPIEFVFKDVNSGFSQREVGRDVDSFEEGLEGALREDPDVIFIGELRNHQDINVAITAAESGRLVVSTMHSKDATRAISRIVNFYGEDQRDATRQRLADCLSAIVSQRLIPKRGGSELVLATEILVPAPTIMECIRDGSRLRGLAAALDTCSSEVGSHSFDRMLIRLVRDGVIATQTAQAVANNASDLVRALKLASR